MPMKTGKELIKQYCDNILHYEGTLEYGSVRTLGDIKREVDKLYTQAEYDEAVKAAKIEGYLRGMLDSGIPDMDVDKRLRRYIEEIDNG